METKNNEVIVKTSNLEEMKGMYLAENLKRVWSEDFADEDTGEVVSMEKNEVVLTKGTILYSKEISEINFFLQSGDIKEVAISNQQRGCNLVNGSTSVWSAGFKLNGKKKNVFLYANSIESATLIAIDYIEQKFDGNFKFTGIKEEKFSNLIPLNMEKEDASEDNKYYKIVVEITYQNEEPSEQTYIISASNAERAKSEISDYITIKNERKDESVPFTNTIISASTISCSNVVDYEFSKNYLNQEGEF